MCYNCSRFLIKIEKRRKKIVEYNLQLHALNGSGIDISIISNNLHCDKHIVNIIKNGREFIEIKVFNGFVEKKQIPQYLVFRCGITDSFKYSLKKVGRTFKLRKELIKTEMNHDEVGGYNYKIKKMNG